jgi:hypothetical protein
MNSALAQDQKNVTVNAWLELGSLKFTPTKHESSAGVDAVIKVQVNHLLASLQYHDYFDSEQAHGGFELFTDDNHYHAGNCMIGITNKKCRFGHVSVSSGLGIFWGEIEDIDSEKFATIGWPLEAAASVNLFPIVGINLKLFTNVNSRHSFFGFGMDIQLGKLRDLRWTYFLPSS